MTAPRPARSVAQEEKAQSPGQGAVRPVSAEVNDGNQKENPVDPDAAVRPADHPGGDGDRGSIPDSPGERSELVELSTERGETSVEPVNVPHVAPPPNVLPFATRGSVKSLKSNGATCGSEQLPHVASGKWQVDAVKVSVGTWAFRLRWATGKKRGTPIYVRRVTDATYNNIRKGNYDAFKKQLIASYCASAVHTGDAA